MSAETKSKVVVTFLYPKKGMSSFNKDYYLKHHIPSTEAAWTPLGMTRCIVCDVEGKSEYAFSVVTLWNDGDEWVMAKGGDLLKM
jgi:hypothetical protein